MNISNLTANSIQLAAQAQVKLRSFNSYGAFFSVVVLFVLTAQLVSSASVQAGTYDKYRRLQPLAPLSQRQPVDFQAYGRDLLLANKQLNGNFSIDCLLSGDCLVRSLEGKFSDFVVATPNQDFINQLQLLPLNANFVFQVSNNE